MVYSSIHPLNRGGTYELGETKTSKIFRSK